MLLLNGGPGCSGWSGLVYEIGPLKYDNDDQYNGSSLPGLVLNPYSWTKVSNIIFIDSPVGTGFSYGRTVVASQTGLFKQVHNLLHFLRKWLPDHPDFKSNPVYLAGDSYSGIPIPILAQQITIENEGSVTPPINLQGYALGNPFTDPSDLDYGIPYAHGMALISDELYESLKKNCRGKYTSIDPSNKKCLKDMQAYEKCISGIHLFYTLSPRCTNESLVLEEIINGRRSLSQDFESFLDAESHCSEHEHLLSLYWANDPSVRRALGIREGTKMKWYRCNFDLPYSRDVWSTIQYHFNLSSKGYRSLIYSGDHDLRVNFLATQAWIRSLNFPIVDDWRPWFVKGQIIAGYTKSYSNRMTFATVKGAGHTAPQYKPKECFAMFKRWIDHQPL